MWKIYPCLTRDSNPDPVISCSIEMEFKLFVDKFSDLGNICGDVTDIIFENFERAIFHRTNYCYGDGGSVSEFVLLLRFHLLWHTLRLSGDGSCRCLFLFETVSIVYR